MNELELQKELARNEADREVANAEIEAYKNKFATYVLENKDRILKGQQTVILKKKKRVMFNEIIDKIKTIFGLKKKNYSDGIKAYLQYSNYVE